MIFTIIHPTNAKQNIFKVPFFNLSSCFSFCFIHRVLYLRNIFWITQAHWVPYFLVQNYVPLPSHFICSMYLIYVYLSTGIKTHTWTEICFPFHCCWIPSTWNRTYRSVDIKPGFLMSKSEIQNFNIYAVQETLYFKCSILDGSSFWQPLTQFLKQYQICSNVDNYYNKK